jgi:hypothetical protein
MVLLGTEGRNLGGTAEDPDTSPRPAALHPLTQRDETAFDYENMITRWAARSTTRGKAVLTVGLEDGAGGTKSDTRNAVNLIKPGGCPEGVSA